MAKYRPIYTKIWKDPDFEEYPPDAKLIFIYLCTNPSTTESGIYPISCTTIANETGVPLPKVKQLFTNGSIKNVLYDQETRHVYIRRFHQYNEGGRPTLIETSITNDFLHTQQTYLWNHFITDYPDFAQKISPTTPLNPNLNPNPNPNRTVSKRLANTLQTVNKGFNTFWKAYPKKMGKLEAREAFGKINPDAGLLAKMLASIESSMQTELWMKEGGKFILDPARWLKRRRWEDEGITLPDINEVKPYTGH